MAEERDAAARVLRFTTELDGMKRHTRTAWATDGRRESVAEHSWRLAKVLDKIETIVEHNQGDNPTDFDYAFNLEYGATLPIDAELVRALRALADEQTRDRARTGPIES